MSDSPIPARHARRLGPEWWVPIIYAAVSAAWIGWSDHLLAALDDPAQVVFLSTVKGWLFVVVTGAALHLWLRRALRRQRGTLQALADSEARFRALIERSTDLVGLLDADTVVRFWSPASAELLGYGHAELLGRPSGDLVHPDDAARVAASFQEVPARPGATGRVRLRLRHRDGSWRLFDSVACNLLHEPAVRGIVVNGRDMTNEARLQEQFLQAQKLESLGRLAGGVAHDFNNLLTVIMGCADGLRSRAEDGGPPALEDVDELRAAASRAGDLTRQLLLFARRQPVRPEAVDLNALVVRTEKVLRRLLGEDVALQVALQDGAWAVRSDPGHLEQLLLNLAVNARDAMPGGGTLAVETANVPDAGGRGPHLRLRVRDTGVGMSEEVRRHLFEPFFTTKPPGRGTGLGLATVYGVVEQSGGFVTVESSPGRGACFDVLLPRTDEPPAPAPAAPAGASASWWWRTTRGCAR